HLLSTINDDQTWIELTQFIRFTNRSEHQQRITDLASSITRHVIVQKTAA
ncbi:hypothetical protein X798_01310, partial [Onchocerca flexuosa]